MTLKQFKDLLLTVSDKVYHNKAIKESSYIVWHEVGQIGTSADNSKAESGWRIAVDYFTKDEYDETPDKISDLFDCDDIASDSPVIDYEPDTGYTHYAWTCEVV